MNGCASYEFLLNEYLDDALDEAQRQQVEAHLAVCPGCRAQVGVLQGVFHSLAVLPEALFSADWAELAARLAAEDAVRRMPGWLPLFTAAQGLLGIQRLRCTWKAPGSGLRSPGLIWARYGGAGCIRSSSLACGLCRPGCLQTWHSACRVQPGR